MLILTKNKVVETTTIIASSFSKVMFGNKSDRISWIRINH